MENLKLELIKITNHTSDVKTFRFKLDGDIVYKPGQYLILTLPVEGKDIPKAFSISSSPTEKGYIEFTKKITDSAFSRLLDSFKVGEICSIRLPMGKFTPLETIGIQQRDRVSLTGFTFDGEFRKAVFLSGGIGITPIRSICKYASDKKLSSSIVVLYSSRTPEQLIFKDDFALMQKGNNNLRVVYTLTQYEEDIPGCRRGKIDEEMVRQEVPDYLERKFFVCGPPVMVEAMRSMLKEKLRIPQPNIITEDFIGY